MTREHIGDLVCTTPALRSLRYLYPQAHIVVEVGERAACVLENNPHIDEILVRPDRQGLGGKFHFIRLLRKRRFDLGIVLDDCADMVLYLWLGGISERAGIARKKRFAKLFTASVPYDPNLHEMVGNFRSVIALLGGEISDASTEVFPSSDDGALVARLFEKSGIAADETLIALNPGASAPSNRWLPERFAALGDLLAKRPRTRILLLGGPGDRTIASEILAHMASAPLELTGKLTVLQLAETLRRCHVLVTGDTGPMHLAVAVKTPVVALFGPALPAESGPGYAPGHTVLRKVESCPNCTKYECREDRRCMHLITAEDALRAVDATLQRSDALTPVSSGTEVLLREN